MLSPLWQSLNYSSSAGKAMLGSLVGTREAVFSSLVDNYIGAGES